MWKKDLLRRSGRRQCSEWYVFYLLFFMILCFFLLVFLMPPETVQSHEGTLSITTRICSRLTRITALIHAPIVPFSARQGVEFNNSNFQGFHPESGKLRVNLSSEFLYLSGAFFKAINPSCLTPEFSIKKTKQICFL